jgi:hypothetical protein
MKFVVTARFVPGADHTPHLEAERERVLELKQQGVIEDAYRMADHSGAYLVVEGPSLKDVEKALATLPYVKSGIMKAELEQVESLSFIWS